MTNLSRIIEIQNRRWVRDLYTSNPCGDASGGFQHGNTCGKGGHGGQAHSGASGSAAKPETTKPRTLAALMGKPEPEPVHAIRRPARDPGLTAPLRYGSPAASFLHKLRIKATQFARNVEGVHRDYRHAVLTARHYLRHQGIDPATVPEDQFRELVHHFRGQYLQRKSHEGLERVEKAIAPMEWLLMANDMREGMEAPGASLFVGRGMLGAERLYD